jgi:hypothetical protein
MASKQRQIDILRKRFRILKNRRINYSRPYEYCNKCVVHWRNSSTIYGYGRKEPKDFLMHEVLHCAVEQLIKHKSKKNQEEFVQDLCKIIYPRV